MDDYQKWLDAQFLDEGAESVSAGDLELQAPIDEREEPTLDTEAASIAAPEATVAPVILESAVPPPVHVEPVSIRPAATVESSAEESALPALDDYIPFLRSRTPETAEPPPSILESPTQSVIQAEARIQSFAGPSQSPAQIRQEPGQAAYTHEAGGQVGQVRPDAVRPRARQARPATAAQSAQPLDPEKLWNLVPKHLQVLIATDSDEIAQNSYKREFKESRIELISRLLDPTLSLEDTARVLNVCPTTVRRYTNKGLLTHQRTRGDQRRFKLSDVLAFLEAQSRKES